MSIYTLIPIIFIVLYAGYWYYVKNKNSQQAQVVNNTDFKAEFANAERYKNSVRLTLSIMPAPNMAWDPPLKTGLKIN